MWGEMGRDLEQAHCQRAARDAAGAEDHHAAQPAPEADCLADVQRCHCLDVCYREPGVRVRVG